MIVHYDGNPLWRQSLNRSLITDLEFLFFFLLLDAVFWFWFYAL